MKKSYPTSLQITEIRPSSIKSPFPGDHNFSDILVIQPEDISCTFLFVFIVGCNLDRCTSFQCQLFTSIIPFQEPSSDFWAFGVEGDGNTGVNTMFLFIHSVGNTHILHCLSMVLMGAMRKVHPSNVHSILYKFQEHFRRTANRSNSADDARKSHLVSCGIHVQV